MQQPAIDNWLREMVAVIEQTNVAELERAVDLLFDTYRAGRTILVCGNGGSASTASHLACDFQKATVAPGAARVRCISLVDNVASLTAWGNDNSFDEVFSQPLRSLAAPGDTLIVISASGNSPNVLCALAAARDMRVRTIALLGFGGGQAASLVDVPVVLESRDYGWVESAHLVLEHVLTYALRDRVRRGAAGG
jgi:D-sedoheptulose 7-phosphate isomerase